MKNSHYAVYAAKKCFEKQSSERDLGVIIDNRLNVSCLGNAIAKRTNEILEWGGGGGRRRV